MPKFGPQAASLTLSCPESARRLDCAKRLESPPPSGPRRAPDAQSISFAGGFALTLLVLVACSSADGPDAARPTGFERDTTLKHEPCDGAAAGNERIDVNGDGRPNIVRVMQGGREVCRILDLNLDGSVDAYVYYDPSGAERRREFDFDRDGRVDEIISLSGGVVFLKERETNFDDQLDTWDYYESGRLVKRERDSDGDGMVDQWWTFNDPADVRCAAVAFDRNYDGQPDPAGVLDVCAEARQKAFVAPIPTTRPSGSAAKPSPKPSSRPAASASAAPAPSASQASPK